MTRKSVIEEPEHHGRFGKSTIIYFDLIIPVILHRFVGNFKVTLLEKILQKRIPQCNNRLSGFNFSGKL